MKKNKVILYLAGISVLFVSTKVIAASADEKNDVLSIARKISTATNRTERARYSEEILNKYEAVKRELLDNLYAAGSKFRSDNSYHSPLHVAILAVGHWQINSADDTLLNLVDYTIASSSLPDGISVTGDFFYPAIRVLVKLRVDPEKVIDSIAKAKNETQIKLLTWVLNERQGDNFAKTKSLLMSAPNNYKTSDEKNNLTIAIGLLEKTKSSVGLIPSPYNKK